MKKLGKELKLLVKSQKKTKTESRPEEMPQIVYEGEESSDLEFKASFSLFDDDKFPNEHQRKKKLAEIHQDIAESLCAFLNSDGGQIIIGVDDDSHVCHGIKHDISKTPGKQTFDVYSQTIKNIMKSFFVKKGFYPNLVHFNPLNYPHDSPSERTVQLFQIAIDPLPENEQKPAVMRVPQADIKCKNCKEDVSLFGQTQQIVFRDGDGDQTFTDLIDGMVEWAIRQESLRSPRKRSYNNT